VAVKRTLTYWIVFFAAGCVLKAALAVHGLDYRYLRLVDPLGGVGGALAIRVMDIGSPNGNGWDMAIPPLTSRIAFWVVFVGVFGLEFAVAGSLVRWVVGRVRRRRQAP
jgi:hypothetical protein